MLCIITPSSFLRSQCLERPVIVYLTLILVLISDPPMMGFGSNHTFIDQSTAFCCQFSERFNEVKDGARLAREKSQEKMEMNNPGLSIAAPQVRRPVMMMTYDCC